MYSRLSIVKLEAKAVFEKRPLFGRVSVFHILKNNTISCSVFMRSDPKFSIRSENLRHDFELPEALEGSDLIKNIDSAIELVYKVSGENAPCLWSAIKYPCGL